MKSRIQKSRIFHPTWLESVREDSTGNGGQLGAGGNVVSLHLPARAGVTGEVNIIFASP